MRPRRMATVEAITDIGLDLFTVSSFAGYFGCNAAAEGLGSSRSHLLLFASPGVRRVRLACVDYVRRIARQEEDRKAVTTGHPIKYASLGAQLNGPAHAMAVIT